ncbi:MAG: hypothetical protein O2854_07625 [Chloroflexi bacterium]|nr:hypothetical protein [Chloroflexota bacterium]
MAEFAETPPTYRSRIFVVKAANRDKANADLEAMGHGPGNFSVPLSADGQPPATHYAVHWNSLTDEPDAKGRDNGDLQSLTPVLGPIKDAGNLWSYDGETNTFVQARGERNLMRIEATE